MLLPGKLMRLSSGSCLGMMGCRQPYSDPEHKSGSSSGCRTCLIMELKTEMIADKQAFCPLCMDLVSICFTGGCTADFTQVPCNQVSHCRLKGTISITRNKNRNILCIIF